jgi:hypothetical protein
MGFLDRAKKLAEQALEKAEDTLADVRTKADQRSKGGGGSEATAGTPVTTDPRMGTPYIPGMLGRAGWRERGLPDPAAVLPIGERDRFGIPHSTRSQIVAEPFGVGRRWSVGGRSAGLFYRLDPDHLAWSPPTAPAPAPAGGGAQTAELADGRSLVFLGTDNRSVVLELSGLDADAAISLSHTVAQQLASL